QPFGLELAQGVSFFFVLSGFILTYVYGDLRRDGWRRYFAARIGRIWPAHLALFAYVVVALPLEQRTPPGSNHLPNALANVFLVQAWMPDFRFIGAFNNVSWSLSVEVFFYLLFPLLILFRDRWLLA